MKLKFILLIVFIFSCFQLANAQSRLNGNVVNSENGKVLDGVNIFITELQKGTVTNAKGEYQFENLPTGKVHIQFSYIGFKSLVKEYTISSGTNSLDVKLQPTSVELSEVVVLGNNVNELDNIPYKVESVSAKQLNLGGSVTLVNALTQLPGVSQLSNGLAITKPVIRGLYGYRIAQVVGGVKIDNQEWQNEHGFALDDIGIGGVDIIEGPASLLFGADALGGVLDILDPKNAPVGKTLGEYNLSVNSNTLGAKTSIGLKGSGEKWNWQLYAGGESNADYSSGGNLRVANTRFAGLSAKGILGYTGDWGFSNLEYIFAHHLYGIVEPTNVNAPETEDRFERGFDGPHHIIDFHIISLKNMFFAGNSKFKVNLGFQNNHRIEDEGNEVKPAGEPDLGELDIILNTFSFDGEWIYSLSNDAELTIGTQGDVKSNTNDGTRILIPDANMNGFSGFAYLKKSFGKLHLDGGLRYDVNKITTTEMGIKDSVGYMKALDLSYNTVNGAIGGVFNANENWTLKLNLATGFRPPNLAELSSNGVHEGTIRYEIGNPAMNLEKNFQVDAGIIYQNTMSRISLTAFDNQVNDFIYLNPTSNTIGIYQVYQYTQTNASLIGGEFSVDVKASELLDLTGSYSTVIGKKSDGTYLPFMPADKIIANAKFNFYDLGSLNDVSFNAGIRSYLKQTRISKGEFETPGYVLVDAGFDATIRWGYQPINLSLNVTNLLDKKYVNALSLLQPLGLYDIGRNISLSVNVPFNMN